MHDGDDGNGGSGGGGGDDDDDAGCVAAAGAGGADCCHYHADYFSKTSYSTMVSLLGWWVDGGLSLRWQYLL